jgi:hypothetical protein
MTDYLPTLINVIPSRRIQRSIKAIAALLLNDDNTHKAITLGAAATPISIAGAFTTGISISADGTTGISITSGFYRREYDFAGWDRISSRPCN